MLTEEAHASLAKHNLLAVLAASDVFLSAIDLPTLARLLRLSRQAKSLLDCYSVWSNVLSPALQSLVLSNDIRYFESFDLHELLFDDIEASVDRKVVLQGLHCYLNRSKSFLPRSFSAHQKELQLWWAVYENPKLHENVASVCRICRRAPSYVPAAKYTLVNGRKTGDEFTDEEQFELLDGAYILDTIPKMHTELLIVIRFARPHPLFLPEQLAGLLPHELHYLRFSFPCDVLLYDCTFTTLSGWPRSLDNITGLEVKRLRPGQAAWDWNQMPWLGVLEGLTPPSSIESLAGIPSHLSKLSTLDLSGCSKITTLAGLPSPMTNLSRLGLPPLLANLADLQTLAATIKSLDMSCCDAFVDLEALPALPALTSLAPSRSIERLAGLSICANSLERLDMGSCHRIESLHDMPRSMPVLETLLLPPRLRTLEGFPEGLDRLTLLNMEYCSELTTLAGLPSLSSLRDMTVPPSIETLEGMPASLESLWRLNAAKSSKLKSLVGLTRNAPQLSNLVLPLSIQSLDGIDPVSYPRLNSITLPVSLSQEPVGLELGRLARRSGRYIHIEFAAPDHYQYK
ncbi:uncharacterized protein BJ171DRAFT_320025 [Polychytrium aggregatum]|uniref:uncharacterized protein n=1 Tax=Polychytrium aggregatum TaxID=110093 RepID=UPI0022FEEAB0|nr:uncharacterized protein BJ171DRAFT_320025 [Polychytrium aggregatum]KAI9193043.1 hypothetical protein BJ171DRAFT_320025 [Polychytrium aggregatum]